MTISWEASPKHPLMPVSGARRQVYEVGHCTSPPIKLTGHSEKSRIVQQAEESHRIRRIVFRQRGVGHAAMERKPDHAKRSPKGQEPGETLTIRALADVPAKGRSRSISAVKARKMAAMP